MPDTKEPCPVADIDGVCVDCKEWTSLCEPCCVVAVEPGGPSSNACTCHEGDDDT